MRLLSANRIILAIASIVVAVVVAWRWPDISIAFHRRAMVASAGGIIREGPTSRQSVYIESFAYHRDALASLGYFERHVFPLQHIRPGTEAWTGLFRALCSAIPNSTVGDIMMRGHEPTTPREVTIWMRAGQQARFESLIRSFDAPPKN